MKYWIIIILFTPLSLYGAVRAVALYKLKKINKFRMALKFIFWVILFGVSIGARYIVNEAIILSITEDDYMTIYDIVLAFLLLISLMLNVRLINGLSDISRITNKLLSMYSINSSVEDNN